MRLFLLYFSAVLTITSFISPAYAEDLPMMGSMFCTVKGWFSGATGKGLATLAIAMIGCWNLMGKISGPKMLMAAAGIAVIFNSGSIIDAMGVGAPEDCKILPI